MMQLLPYVDARRSSWNRSMRRGTPRLPGGRSVSCFFSWGVTRKPRKPFSGWPTRAGYRGPRRPPARRGLRHRHQPRQQRALGCGEDASAEAAAAGMARAALTVTVLRIRTTNRRMSLPFGGWPVGGGRQATPIVAPFARTRVLGCQRRAAGAWRGAHPAGHRTVPGREGQESARMAALRHQCGAFGARCCDRGRMPDGTLCRSVVGPQQPGTRRLTLAELRLPSPVAQRWGRGVLAILRAWVRAPPAPLPGKTRVSRAAIA